MIHLSVNGLLWRRLLGEHYRAPLTHEEGLAVAFVREHGLLEKPTALDYATRSYRVQSDCNQRSVE